MAHIGVKMSKFLSFSKASSSQFRFYYSQSQLASPYLRSQYQLPLSRFGMRAFSNQSGDDDGKGDKGGKKDQEERNEESEKNEEIEKNEKDDVFDLSRKSLVHPTVPSVYPEVMILPVARRPLFPLAYQQINLTDNKVFFSF